MKRHKAVIIAIALSFCCAVFTCFVSNNLWSRFEHRDDIVNQQLAILKGESYRLGDTTYYLPMFQNRLIFPAALTACSHLKTIPLSKWYLLLRWLTAFGAFLSFYYLLVKVLRADYPVAAAGMMLLAYELILTFNFGYEVPSDFIDVIFMSSFLWAALRRRRWALFALAVLGSANRESAVYAGILWLCYYGLDDRGRVNTRESVFAFVVSTAAYGSALMLRYGFAPGKMRLQDQQWILGWLNIAESLKDFFRNPTNSSWPVLLSAMAIPLVFWIGHNRRVLSVRHIKLLFAVEIIGLSSIMFGRIIELRIFIPMFVVLIFVAVSMKVEASRFREALPR